MKPKIAIIGTVGVPALYGGFETLLENLLDYLPEAFDVTVFCESDAYPSKLETYKDARLVYVDFKANGLQSIFFDAFSILRAFAKNDFLLILGVSGTVMLPFIKPFCRAKIITNIDGMEWKREKWGRFQKMFLKLSEKFAVQHSDLVIADNFYIQEHVANSYGVAATLIAYGGDHVSLAFDSDKLEHYGLSTSGYFFTVCRIEPENNLEILLEGFLASESTLPYVIVGNWQASKFGRNLRGKYIGESKLRLLDPIYDQIELDQLRSNCYFYLHGHSAGGTNPSLVEAMYLGLPIISFGVSYNRSTTHDLAVYFSDRDSLVNILSNLDGINRELLSAQMREIANTNYTWEIIARKYMAAIGQL
nr:DUF1972 domain-containing protein [Cytophagales bacterium]